MSIADKSPQEKYTMMIAVINYESWSEKYQIIPFIMSKRQLIWANFYREQFQQFTYKIRQISGENSQVKE